MELMGSSDLVAFASSPAEWQPHFIRMTEFEHRQRCSTEGLAFAQKHCRFEDVAPRWQKVLLG
jgi:hypothetical protein